MDPQSFATIRINYPPDCKTRYGYGRPLAKHLAALIEAKAQVQLDFLDLINGQRKNLSAIAVDAEATSPEPRWNQDWFPPLDGMSLYTMLASQRPQRYLEIGSGNTTKFAARAVRDHSLETKIISIDPRPRTEIDALCDAIVRQPLEDLDDRNSPLSELEPGDVLFFDGSHRSFQNSDVTVFFIDILPALPDGVIVGIHDIFWPYDYPEQWLNRYYNEQYVLGAYMLGMGSRFNLLFSCKYMATTHSDVVSGCLNDELVADLRAAGLGLGGGSLWFAKSSH